MRVAVCGLGRMGVAMAARLVDASHDVAVWNRTPGRSVVGARAATSPAEAAAGADVVLLALLDGPASCEVLLALSARTGTLVVNVATVGPSESVELAGIAESRSLRYVEAPVLGSVPAVRSGTLRVLCSGDPTDVDAARPALSAFADDVRAVGPIGVASGLKLVANSTLGVASAAIGDATALGAQLGLPADAVLDILEAGHLGGLVAAKRSKIESHDHGGADFTVAALAKDLALALLSASAAEPESMPVIAAAAGRAIAYRDAGSGDADVSLLMDRGAVQPA